MSQSVHPPVCLSIHHLSLSAMVLVYLPVCIITNSLKHLSVVDLTVCLSTCSPVQITVYLSVCASRLSFWSLYMHSSVLLYTHLPAKHLSVCMYVCLWKDFVHLPAKHLHIWILLTVSLSAVFPYIIKLQINLSFCPSIISHSLYFFVSLIYFYNKNFCMISPLIILVWNTWVEIHSG